MQQYDVLSGNCRTRAHAPATVCALPCKSCISVGKSLRYVEITYFLCLCSDARSDHHHHHHHHHHSHPHPPHHRHEPHHCHDTSSALSLCSPTLFGVSCRDNRCCRLLTVDIIHKFEIRHFLETYHHCFLFCLTCCFKKPNCCSYSTTSNTSSVAITCFEMWGLHSASLVVKYPHSQSSNSQFLMDTCTVRVVLSNSLIRVGTDDEQEPLANCR